MSLRIRLIASILIVLLLSLCAGGLAAWWHAIRSVRTEMQAALGVAAQTLRNGIDVLPASGDRREDLRRLVLSFNGDRHVRVVLRDAADRTLVASIVPALAPDVPEWFVAGLTPSLTAARLDVAEGGAITAEPDPRNEIGEVWTQLRDDFLAVGLFCGLSIALVSFVVGRALRPLDRLSDALAALKPGEYAMRVNDAGPPELARLARGFNTMAERLEAARQRNNRLNQQLLTLQDEERRELARDLHDEVGPFLFAVNLDAAAIEQAAASGRLAEIPERAGTIREAVGHMQRHVRDILNRLRPSNPVDTGLAQALEKLVTFWRARQPGIDFSLAMTVDEDMLGHAVMTTIYRVVQEALNNAIRHGHARRIDVTVAGAVRDVSVVVRDDGTGFSPSGKPGLGIVGMRERVEGLGGTLRVGAGEQGTGLVVTAWIPYASAMEGV